MHTIKITPNLLFEYHCTSGKFIRLPNRIETFFCPNWNALPSGASRMQESLLAAGAPPPDTIAGDKGADCPLPKSQPSGIGH